MLTTRPAKKLEAKRNAERCAISLISPAPAGARFTFMDSERTSLAVGHRGCGGSFTSRAECHSLGSHSRMFTRISTIPPDHEPKGAEMAQFNGSITPPSSSITAHVSCGAMTDTMLNVSPLCASATSFHSPLVWCFSALPCLFGWDAALRLHRYC
jgi:hypothetical protein